MTLRIKFLVPIALACGLGQMAMVGCKSTKQKQETVTATSPAPASGKVTSPVPPPPPPPPAKGKPSKMAAPTAVITPAGNRIVNFTNKEGAKCQAGELLKINVYTYIRDSLITSTVRDMGGPQELPLPDKSELPQVPAVFDALYLMAPGDSASAFMPVDSTMAQNIPKELGVVKEIRFDVVVVSRMTKEDVDKKAAEDQKRAEATMARLPEVKSSVDTWLAAYKAKALGDKLQKTASGLEYMILEPGTGALLQKGSSIPTHYYGCLMDGTPFDNSFERGEEAPFTIGQMIPGFDEGLMLLKPGGKAVFFIPYPLAYGEEGIPGGPIPAKSDLVFYVELKK